MEQTSTCKRCNKEFNVNELDKSFITLKFFSRCSDCIKDVEKRNRLKQVILKKLYQDRTEEENLFLKNHTNINVPIPKTINPYRIIPIEKIGDKTKCVECGKYKNSDEFYDIAGSKNRKCKDCTRRNALLTEVRPDSYMYIIINPAWKGYFKIGRASSFKVRLNGYNTGDPFRQYKYLFKSKLCQAHIIENLIGNSYDHLKVDSNYEWYKLDDKQLQEIIDLIESNYNKTKDQIIKLD